MHKLLFLGATIGAWIFLREKPSPVFFLGALLVIAGNAFLVRPLLVWDVGLLLVACAIVFWSAEQVLARALLSQVSGRVLALGRMAFGAVFIFAYLLVVGKAGGVVSMSVDQYVWIVLTSVLLLGYVLTYYEGLARVPVSVATSVLALGAPLTLVLDVIVFGRVVALADAAGVACVVGGVAVILVFARQLRVLRGAGYGRD
ncbi:MAG: EamA family transporter [Nitrosarchaeum sp.]|nr:EamA family transporter [Nitrosarchaeum sp.]